jgi:hypothetical protein
MAPQNVKAHFLHVSAPWLAIVCVDEIPMRFATLIERKERRRLACLRRHRAMWRWMGDGRVI